MLGLVLAVAASAAGMGLLYLGGELLVRNAAHLARRAGVTPFLIGVTVVAFGTSAPELAVGVTASAAGQSDVAIGNVLGSNVFNIAVVLGLSAIVYPIMVRRAVLRREMIFLPLTTAIFAALALDGEVSRLDGAVLLAVMGIVVVLAIRGSRREMAAGAPVHDHTPPATPTPPAWRSIGGTVAGLVILVGGAQALVLGAVELAAAAGVPVRIVALTIVAGGTSLPELVTSIIAARARQHDIALGNVIGSNLFNLVGIVGAAAVVRPLVFATPFHADFIAMMLFTIGMMIAARHRHRITRGEGALLVAGYIGYLAFLLR